MLGSPPGDLTSPEMIHSSCMFTGKCKTSHHEGAVSAVNVQCSKRRMPRQSMASQNAPRKCCRMLAYSKMQVPCDTVMGRACQHQAPARNEPSHKAETAGTTTDHAWPHPSVARPNQIAGRAVGRHHTVQ